MAWTASATPAANYSSITTIVHGTWARRSAIQTKWWEPQGQFAQAVDGVVGDLYKHNDYFFWSGANSDSARRQAARDFVQWVNQRLTSGGSLRVICHSHGGNVALLAATEGLHINKLILLGTPIRTDYLPRLDRVDRLVNIFSPTDHVQTAGALGRRRGEGRTLADTSQISNHCTIDPNTGHSDLHDWSVWQQPGNNFGALLL
jgi:hypothetical protein